jgi:hypothetical protein
VRILLLLIAGALFAVGCGSSAEPAGAGGQGAADPSDPTGTSAPSAPVTPSASSLTPAPGSQQPSLSKPLPPPPAADPTTVVPADLLEKVLTDAASRTGVPRSAVSAVSAVAQTWNDGSLGCPEPGMAYTQVITDGYQIMVSAAGRTLDYRTSTQGAVKVCDGKR